MEDYSFMFCGRTEEELDLSGLDWHCVKKADYLFQGCTRLRRVVMQDVDASSLISFEGAFNQCHSLEELILTNWKTSSLRTLAYLCCECPNLRYVDLSGWDVRNVTDVSMIFYDCLNLIDVNINGWCLSKVSAKNFRKAFFQCENLTKLNLYGVNAREIWGVDAFLGCRRLKNMSVKPA